MTHSFLTFLVFAFAGIASAKSKAAFIPRLSSLRASPFLEHSIFAGPMLLFEMDKVPSVWLGLDSCFASRGQTNEVETLNLHALVSYPD